MTKVIGDLVYTGEQEIMTVGVKDLAVITKGLAVYYDANGFAQPDTGSGTRATGIHIALETKTGATDGVIKVQVAIGNTYVYCQAGAATIKPNMLLKVTTGGKLILHADPGTPALNAIFSDTEVEAAILASTNYYGKAIGRYILQEGEEASASNPADNAVIGVRLGVD